MPPQCVTSRIKPMASPCPNPPRHNPASRTLPAIAGHDSPTESSIDFMDRPASREDRGPCVRNNKPINIQNKVIVAMNTIVIARHHHARRRGLTLIELVVVLAILVALVGLVVSLFPGLVARASRSTTASSLQDVARAVQINYTTTLSYGSGFDSLLNSGGGSVYSGLAVSSSNQIARVTLSQNDANALNSAGVGIVYHMTQTTGNSADATFNVSLTNSPVTVTTSTPIAVLDATQSALLQSVRGSYVPRGTAVYPVFGLNKYSTLVGPQGVMQDAPVRAGSASTENPASTYQRYGLVFLIDDSGPSSTRTARFLGAVAFTASGIQTAEANLQGYYAN